MLIGSLSDNVKAARRVLNRVSQGTPDDVLRGFAELACRCTYEEQQELAQVVVTQAESRMGRRRHEVFDNLIRASIEVSYAIAARHLLLVRGRGVLDIADDTAWIVLEFYPSFGDLVIGILKARCLECSPAGFLAMSTLSRVSVATPLNPTILFSVASTIAATPKLLLQKALHLAELLQIASDWLTSEGVDLTPLGCDLKKVIGPAGHPDLTDTCRIKLADIVAEFF